MPDLSIYDWYYFGEVDMGTIINSNTALTHNHFGPEGGATPPGDLLVDGQSIPFFDPVGPIVTHTAETGLITVNSDFSGNPAELASQDVISSLADGSTVQVVYWNDTNQEITMTSLNINHNYSGEGFGVIHLNDPNQILNRADSGGGVFYNGQLIGNLWGFDPKENRVWVAIIPSNPYLTNSSKATTPAKSNVR